MENKKIKLGDIYKRVRVCKVCKRKYGTDYKEEVLKMCPECSMGGYKGGLLRFKKFQGQRYKRGGPRRASS